MSFIFDIRNLKDCSDYKKKRKEFFNMLHLKQKLNKNYEQAMNYRMQMEDMGVQPTKAPVKTIEQEAQDVLLQQELARKNLDSIMKDGEARAVISKMSDSSLYQMNSIFPRLADALKGRTNITAAFFMSVYQRFMTSLEHNGDGAERIPLPEQILSRLTGDLLDRWMQWSRGDVNPLTGQTENERQLIQETATQTDNTVEEIQDIIREEVRSENEPVDTPGANRLITPVDDMEGALEPVPAQTVNQSDIIRTKFETDFQRARDMGTQFDSTTADDVLLGEAQKKIGYAPVRGGAKHLRKARQTKEYLYGPQIQEQQQDMARQIQANQQYQRDIIGQGGGGRGIDFDATVENADQTQSNRQTEDQTTRVINEQVNPQRRRQDNYLAGPARRPELFRQMDEEEARDRAIREGIRQDVERRMAMMRRRSGGERSGPGGAGVGKPRMGKGTKIARQNGKIIGKIGKGIAENYEETDRFREFGKYMLHMPSLRKCYIYICYNSGMKINHIPRRLVSTDFVKMIEDCMEEGTLDKTLFNKLNEEEQDFFRVVAKKCEFDKSVGLGIHRTEGEKKLMDRFELLKGEIVAGNNAPEVMKELKSFVLKFMNDGTLNRQQGNQLLYEIAVLG